MGQKLEGFAMEESASGSAIKPKVNILVVDDSADNQLVFRTVLEELRENIVTASSGEEALKCLLVHEFAVVLLDVKMPGMDGFETAALIRKRRRFFYTPIIFVTAYEDAMHTSEAYSLGAVDYILTPIMPDVLRTKVKVFVQLFRMNAQVRQQAEERVALAKAQAARALAEDSIRRSNFLVGASEVVSGSLDAQTTVREVTHFAVPFLAELCALLLFDETGRIVEAEGAWMGHSGVKMTLAPTTLREVFREELHDAVARALNRGKPDYLELVPPRIVAQARASTAGEHAPDGAFAALQAAVYPLHARGRKVGALLLGVAAGRSFGPMERSLAFDLAGRIAIALDNALLYRRIQEADQRKDQFLAMLAHELRNPLAPLRSAVAVMRHMVGQEPMFQWSRDIIERQVEYIARLVDDLLDVARVTQGKIKLDKGPVALASVVARALETSRPAIDGHKHRLAVTLPPDSVYVNGDPLRLAQVIDNLLANAAKYTDDEGEIELAVERSGKHVLLRVKDNGCGLGEEVQARVFDLFFQADRSLARSEGGLGIGLTLVRSLVELHEGTVEAKSAGPGKGSEFIVRLPVLDKVPVETIPPTVAVLPATHKSPARVLLIDDNADANDMMEALLCLYGHEVRKALDGPTALEIAREFKPHMVLCENGLRPATQCNCDCTRSSACRSPRSRATVESAFVCESKTP